MLRDYYMTSTGRMRVHAHIRRYDTAARAQALCVARREHEIRCTAKITIINDLEWKIFIKVSRA